MSESIGLGERMNTYVRKSRKLEKGTYMITKYTAGEYLFLNIVKLVFFVLILWPVEIVLFTFLFLIKLLLGAAIVLLLLPVKVIHGILEKK